jgi:hypothetical protein
VVDSYSYWKVFACLCCGYVVVLVYVTVSLYVLIYDCFLLFIKSNKLVVRMVLSFFREVFLLFLLSALDSLIFISFQGWSFLATQTTRRWVVANESWFTNLLYPQVKSTFIWGEFEGPVHLDPSFCPLDPQSCQRHSQILSHFWISKHLLG